MYRVALLAVAIAVGGAAAAAEPKLVIVNAGPKIVKLAPADIAGMTRASVTATFHGKPLACEGVWLTDVLARAGAETGEKLRGKAMMRVVVATGADDYRVAFTLGELDHGLGNSPVLVADRCDGAPLPAADGPLRLVAAQDGGGARSVRQLIKLEVIP